MRAEPFLLSFLVAGLSTLLVVILGLPLARWFARHHGPGARVLDALATAPLVLPPVVTGYYLLMLFGPHGPIGRLLEAAGGLRVVFHWSGAVLASAVVAFPLFVRSARAALQSVPAGYLETSAVCGAGPLRTFVRVHLPMAFPGVLAGTLLAFARGLGEFGATVMVAGNIPGKTQTLPLAIYEAVFSGNLADANIMVGVVTALAVALLVAADRLQARAARAAAERT